MDRRHAFFKALFGNAEPGYWFVLWTTPDKQTYPFPATDEGIVQALSKVAELDDGTQNVYVGTYLLAEPPRKGRGDLKDVLATCAFWIDIDILGPNHNSKTLYPPTVAEATRILDAMPIPPSAVVNTGGGLHGWWFFPEPLSIEDADDRTEISDLRDRWKATCQRAARSLGYATDSVWDFARVMRVPETLNVKSKPPTRGEIVSIDPLVQYGQTDFEEVLSDIPDPETGRKVVPISMEGIELRYLDARPEKVIIALESDPKFRRTWAGKRRDLEDQSPSAYCFAIAIYLANLGLTDEQIAQCLYTWRLDHGASHKSDEWYSRTIGRARNLAGVQSEAAEFLTEFRDEDVPDRSKLLAGLSGLLEFEIDDVVVIDGSDEQTYRLSHRGVSRKFGTAKNILSQALFREKMAQFGRLPKKIEKKEQWDEVVAILLAAARPSNLGEGGTEAGRASGWIRDFLVSRPVSRETSARDAFNGDRPFYWNEDRIAIFGPCLLKWVRDRMRSETGLTPSDFDQAMEQAGCYQTEKRFNFYPGGVRWTGRAWVIPEALHQQHGENDE